MGLYITVYVSLCLCMIMRVFGAKLSEELPQTPRGRVMEEPETESSTRSLGHTNTNLWNPSGRT